MVRISSMVLILWATVAFAAEPQIRVALYVDKGTSETKELVKKVLESMPETKLETVTAEDIREGKLKGFQMLVMPGGTGGGHRPSPCRRAGG
jgi:phosphoribosylformylglycinamidine (FGAM) synthase-like amidotransferase family enzyme